MNKLRITLMKSVISTTKRHRDTIRGLGLRRREQVVELADTPEIRGMLRKVAYLVKCEVVHVS